MKNLFAIVLLIVGCSPVLASGEYPVSKSHAKLEDPDAGDLVPWPWGIECPFPWDEVDGAWQVKGRNGQEFDRHTLAFETAEDVRDGIKLLYVYHYDGAGHHIGTGTGVSVNAGKKINAIMTKSNAQGISYRLILRSYAYVRGASCRAGKQAMTVTFCPPRGKKCLEDQNYLLVK